jgi:putative heme iron utilization protein
MKDDAKALLGRVKTGTLSVLDFETGVPFGALVNVATDDEGLPLFLFSNMARHTKSLLKNPSASLLVSELPSEGDALTGLRATITGEVVEVKADPTRYLTQHPYAEVYIGFADFGFWRMRPKMIYVVGGFGKIASYAWE